MPKSSLAGKISVLKFPPPQCASQLTVPASKLWEAGLITQRPVHTRTDGGTAPWSHARVPDPDPERLASARKAFEQGLLGEEAPPVKGGALIRRLPAWLPGLVRSAGTKALHPWSRRKFARLQGEDLRLHLGCGWSHIDGWVNIDLFLTRADVVWDLRHGIPLQDDSVEAIFHEHLMEHLPLRAGFDLARASLRVLRPGGILRIGVPDAGACVASYAGLANPDWANSQPTGLLAVEALFYGHGHCAMYDAETLTILCRAAGFTRAQPREWGESNLTDVPDTPVRKGGTLYVEAVK
jgi:predicted SAM-dependent methyltransferase